MKKQYPVNNNSSILLYNTMSKKLETLICDHVIGMYHCGPTVYSYATIGNMRSYIFADTIRRTIETLGGKVTQVINITDVGHIVADADQGEDKIELAAKQQKKSAQEIADFYTSAFMQDILRLNIRTQDTLFPKASEHIQEQIALITMLEKNGHTYTTSDGVYFDTTTFADYGKLGDIDLQGLMSGARVEENHEKRNLTDFALWKFSKPGEQRLQQWESPWGIGFPGWHIECSAMSMKYLGTQFDIHTGGIDHIPVHHNNEIAQSVCATHDHYARIWMHNEFMNVDGRKMSKSLGNVYTVQDLVDKKYHQLALRYFFLLASYRLPLNFTFEALTAAHNALLHLYEITETHIQRQEYGYEHMSDQQIIDSAHKIQHVEKNIHEAMSNELNTSEVISIVWNTIKDQSITAKDKIYILTLADKYLGLSIVEHTKLPSEEARNIALQREEKRKLKDYAGSDELKKSLVHMKYTVRDTPEGPLLFQSDTL